MRRIPSHAASRTTSLAGAILMLLLVPTTRISAQSIAMEAGLAGIENYNSYTPLLGAALFTPTWNRLRASASVSRWGGRDGNEFASGTSARSGYGNQAFVVSGLFRVVGGSRAALSLGAGLGWFQYFVPTSSVTSAARYDRTTLGSVLVEYAAAPRLAPYLRADVEAPHDGMLHYGLVRLGMAVRLGR